MSSLIPYIFNELMDELNSPQPIIYDQNFGLGMHSSLDYVNPRIMRVPLNSGYVRPWRHTNYGNSGTSSMENSRTDFRINLDVQQFKPEEVSVKLQDYFLIIDAKHEEREDKHGFISRHFTRRYKLPENIDLEKIKSNLSSDGVLTVTAPKKSATGSGERTIQIERTNQPCLKPQTPRSHAGEGEQTLESQTEQ